MRHRFPLVSRAARRWRALFIAPLLSLGGPLFGVQALSVDVAPNSAVEVALESFLDEAPPVGFAPVRVTLRSRATSPQHYRLDYTTGDNASNPRATGSAHLSVAAQGRSQTYVYIPVLGQSYADIELNLSGPGVRDGSTRIVSKVGGWNNTGTFVGFGDQTEVAYTARVKKRLEELVSGGSRHGWDLLNTSKIIPAAAPADWRAYAGFSSIWFSAVEWDKLDPGARAAICEWIGMGGKLHLLFSSDAQRSSLDFPGATMGEDNSVLELGLGSITGISTGGTSDTDVAALVEKMAKVLQSETSLLKSLQKDDRTRSTGGYTNWGLGNHVEMISRNVTMLSIFMVFFALLIGPVNFFLLAPSRRRHRLLWTTPLIALGASFLLGLIILLSDGIGGQGARLTLACLLPEQKRLVIKQEQLSRTGLLLGDAFVFPGEASLLPISVPGSRNYGNYTQTDNGWSGDWFRSRARQGQFASTVKAVRGGIHVTLPAGDDPGSVLTAFEIPLAEIYITSPDGESIYKATRLAPGARRPLESVSREEFASWESGITSLAGAVLAQDLKTIGKKKGWFFAKAASPADLALATLDAITWQHDIAVVAGPVEFVEKTPN